jgi:uncharacterized protein YkwD
VFVTTRPQALWCAISRASIVRLLLPAVLAVGLVMPFAAGPIAANQAPSAAEAYALKLINAERAKVGRVALQWDSRAADVAQWRSDDQASKNNMTHNLDGVIDKFQAKGITWYAIGEALVHGTPRTAMESAEEAVRTWRASDAHWKLLSSADYDFNYIALGMTRARDGWYYWTALVFEGPDRTPPRAHMSSANMGKMAAGGRIVTVSWSGADVRLFSHTAGLQAFRLQRRIGSGDWKTLTNWTTATSKSYTLDTNRTYYFRIKARDKNGNQSAWSTALKISP